MTQPVACARGAAWREEFRSPIIAIVMNADPRRPAATIGHKDRTGHKRATGPGIADSSN
jgi:hypothetical protein